MLCVTGAETSAVQLLTRLQCCADAQLQEVRLDCLDEPAGLRVSDVSSDRLLLACRSKSEGGCFAGNERDRLQVLGEALANLQPRWVDVEASIEPRQIERLIELAHRVGTKVIISKHIFKATVASVLDAVVAEISELRGDAIKIAVAVNDASELQALKAIGEQTRVPKVLIGMGPAGLLSRALYNRFGSIWTYVASDDGNETAAGQFSSQKAEQWRLPVGEETGLYVLLGGPQVFGSPGPDVYNRLFVGRDIDACYLPVVTAEPDQTLALLHDLGLRGASVTMPLKEGVVRHLARLDGVASELGVVNTIAVEEGGVMVGTMTDGEGALNALLRHIEPLRGKDVVLLGTGSTALAIAASLRAVGARVTLLGRDRDRANSAASKAGVRSGHLSALPQLEFQVLINATPVGANDPDTTLVERPERLAGKVVLDVVYSRETRLLRETRANGGVAVSGRTMWSEQGRLQLKRWFDIDVPAAHLEEVLR